jgi:hypothetical protein
MTKYQEFLNTAGIISEDLFNEIVNSLPEYDSNKVDFSNIYMLDIPVSLIYIGLWLPGFHILLVSPLLCFSLLLYLLQ